MANAHIFCSWGPGELSNDRLAFLCAEFARRLKNLDPLLSEFGPTGEKNGFENMLKQPLVSGMSARERDEILDSQRHGGVIALAFWNRRTVKDEFFAYTLYADRANGTRISVRALSKYYDNSTFIKETLQIMIEALDCLSAEVYELISKDPSGLKIRHAQLWLRDGQPWPTGLNDRYKETHQSDAGVEPWLGGKLYMWPENAG